jgi:hypothetical protein
LGEREQAGSVGSGGPRYARPKILLMDMAETVESQLTRAGYSVEAGTFGRPINIDRDIELWPVPRGEIPINAREQEVVVVDTLNRASIDDDLAYAEEGELRIWQSAADGVINPRPVAMRALRVEALDRILQHGGVFIAFLDERLEIDYVTAEFKYRTLVNEEKHRLSSWGFLEILDQVGTKRDGGSEYELTDLGQGIPGLSRAMKGSTFRCSISQGQLYSQSWIPLATNKYGEVISAILNPSEDGSGVAFLLPRIEQPGRLILDLLAEFLPRVAPSLFPHIQRADWVREPPYELPEIQALEQETAAVEAQAAIEVKQLEDQISAKRAERSYLYELLTATDSELVTAVKQTLELLGFEKVIDVDEEAESQTTLREDLQIMDRSPSLLSEVKGIAGLPREAYSLQVDKYIAPRMREWGRTDVQGLTIINHELGKPGLDRQQDHVFQDDVITNAEARRIGLLTTWELYRLARNFVKNDWQHEQVIDLFYRSGVIRAIPTHYELVGTVENYYDQVSVAAIRVSGPVRAGDTLAFELPIEWEEREITSMEINNQPVDESSKGDLIGVKTDLTKEQAKVGMSVYRVGT